MYVDRYRMLTGKDVDLLVVDYGDLLRPDTKERNSNSYQDGGSIYSELRAIAGELGVPLWTASQSNRCLTLDTIVSTKCNNISNTTTIGKLKVGDKIQTHVGYKRVKKIFPTQMQPVYRIKLKNGKYITCSANHEFPTKYGMLKSISTGLKIGDNLFCKKM